MSADDLNRLMIHDLDMKNGHRCRIDTGSVICQPVIPGQSQVAALHKSQAYQHAIKAMGIVP